MVRNKILGARAGHRCLPPEVGQPPGNHSEFRKRDGQRKVRWEGHGPDVTRYECAAGGFMWTGIDHLGKVRLDRNVNLALAALEVAPF